MSSVGVLKLRLIIRLLNTFDGINKPNSTENTRRCLLQINLQPLRYSYKLIYIIRVWRPSGYVSIVLE